MTPYRCTTSKGADVTVRGMTAQELVRTLVDQGAEIIFVPFCTDDRQAYLRVRYCAQARAIENIVYLALAGNTGDLPNSENIDIQYALPPTSTSTSCGGPPPAGRSRRASTAARTCSRSPGPLPCPGRPASGRPGPPK